MFVEDMITDLSERLHRHQDPVGQRLQDDAWHRKFVESVGERVSLNKPLSSKQGATIVKLVRQLRPELEQVGYAQYQLERLISFPQYKREPYESQHMPREVRYLGDNKLAFRFKRVEEVLNNIKSLGTKMRDANYYADDMPRFDRQMKCWIVGVNTSTLSHIMYIISQYEFDADDAVVEFLTLCHNSRQHQSSFVFNPVDNTFILNICDNPILASFARGVLYADLV